MKNSHETTTLTDGLLNEILFFKKSPCLSLYQPTKRSHPDNEQDQIIFKKLVEELESTLLQQYEESEVRSFLEPFHSIYSDTEFWKHTLDGLAILSGPDFFKIFKLPQSFLEFTLVAENFHSAPLRHYLQSIDRYQILSVGYNKMRFFEGNSHFVEEIELSHDMPQTIVQALGPEEEESNKDDTINDLKRFFRIVDKAVFDKFSKVSKLPLILVALPEHHHFFHLVSNNQFLIKDGVSVNSESKTNEEIHALTWKVIEPLYQNKLDKVTENYKYLKSKNLGSEDLVDIVKAATDGRVETLIVGGELELYGHINEEDGAIDFDDLPDLHGEDLLNELEEIVVSKGGHLQVIRSGNMQIDIGLAAIYRY
jgi:hypothetical protein